MIKQHALGNTGIDISMIGLGTVKLGRSEGVKYPTPFRIPNDTEALSLLQLAQELGINLLDTAPAYGNSEERIGNLLQNPALKNQRKHWVICTKTGETFDAGQSHFDFSPEQTVKSVHRSLKRLHTDYLDIVLVHSDGNDLRIINELGTLDALAELKCSGKIRAFGMSTKTLEGSLLAAEKSDAVMLTYNLNSPEEKNTLDFCMQHNKGVLIKKALGSGHLIKPDENFLQDNFDFIFSHQAISSVIIGTISPEHLRHNINSAVQSIMRKK